MPPSVCVGCALTAPLSRQGVSPSIIQTVRGSAWLKAGHLCPGSGSLLFGAERRVRVPQGRGLGWVTEGKATMPLSYPSEEIMSWG